MLDLMKFVGYSGKGTSNYGQPQQPTTSDQNNHREIFAMYSVFDQFHVVTVWNRPQSPASWPHLEH